MPRHSLTFGIIATVLLGVPSLPSVAAAVTGVAPLVCQPGTTTRLTVAGTDLDQTLRAVTSCCQARVEIESVAAEQAILNVSLPADAALGPLGLWLATAAGPQAPWILLVDDLPAVDEAADHHSVATAQPLPHLAAVRGTLDAAKRDYYRIQVSAGQQLSFEVRAQAIESALDPVVRILDNAGQTVRQVDDSAIGPDVRFSHRFATEGTYLIEIQESGHRGGAYYLRVGDFPLLHPPSPLAVRRGEAVQVHALTSDESLELATAIEVPVQQQGHTTTVGMRRPEGKSSAWVRIGVADEPQVIESTMDDHPLQIPVGITGGFDQGNETDQYTLRGIQGRRFLFRCRARSLHSPALVQMHLTDGEGKTVAQTQVADSDEWSFEYTFPDDRDYTLSLTDLLHRGGAEYRYWVGITPAPGFRVSLKPAAQTRTEFAIETEHGACPIDLAIERTGYDGPLRVELAEPTSGLSIVNPTIPAQAKEARIYLSADSGWTPQSAEIVSLVATAEGSDTARQLIDGLGLHRAKSPAVPFPIPWRDGNIHLGGVAVGDPFFAFQPMGEIEFARPVTTHAASFELERINAEFKSAVTVWGHALPDGWTVSAAADGDTYRTTLTRGGHDTEPDHVALAAFAEFNGRGRVETIELPIRWVDPIQVTVTATNAIVAGSTTKLLIEVERAGSGPQAATLKWKDVPTGVTLPESIVIAPDQTRLECDLTVSADTTMASVATLAYELSSTYEGHEFTVAGQTNPLTRIDPPVRIAVYPSEIHLSGPKRRQQLVVTGYDADGVPRDWSLDVSYAATDPQVAELRGTVVFPQQNGETEIVVAIGDLRQSIPVTVTGFESESPIEFESEVLVALSKQGCNAGACHGSPSGKGMFRLSLRAFDVQLDELTLIREDWGRRINRIEPEKSLLLMKPTMAVSHGGGKQLRKEDPAYEILRDWIAEGAHADADHTPRPTRLEIFPREKQILKQTGGGRQLAVTAHFADGSSRDVTHLVAYETSDPNVATVDVNGWVSPGGRGEATVLVRYLEFIESLQLMFVDPIADFQWTAPAESNYIDELVNAKLKQLQYLPAETCTDSEFLRRVHLDLIGTLPTVAESEAFLADTSDGKRAALIDALLEREEFAKFWALKWGDLLKMTGKLVGSEGIHKYYRWVEQAWADNLSYDQFARQLITASGSTLANPPANFYRTATDTNERVETISQVFLGARLQCAKCHNHPFERWTQDNYYGLSAFFHRVQRRMTQRPGEMFIWNDQAGEVTQPRTGQQMSPWVPGEGELTADDEQDRRRLFADWLVDPHNPYFARIEANRIWSQLFARGIVDPIDDFRDSNPPSNEPLLDALAEDFVNSGFDRKHLLRQILNSRTYQASFQTNPWNEQDTAYFSHQQPRMLGAEQLLDAVNHLLDLPETFGGLPAGTKATQLPAPDIVKVEFLKAFGQPERSTVCACERTADSNLGMAIELFNGTTVHHKLRDPNNRFRKAVAAGQPAEQIIRELYVAAFCRPPTDDELSIGLEHCAARGDIAAGLEDVCWALLNTDEFLFQH